MKALGRIRARILAAVARACARVILPCRQTIGTNVREVESVALNGPVCILVPHPDDEVIGCFHFMKRVAQSAAIDLIYVTDDPDKPLADLRRAEAIRATSGIPVRSRIWWGYADGRLQSQEDQLRHGVDQFHERYCYVLCPAPSDLTPDHAVLAAWAQESVPPDKLLWYRSTWLTFPLRSADLVASGDALEKLAALREFTSQGSLALENVISTSRYEARAIGLGASSIEGFRFASSGAVDVQPVNALSVLWPWMLRGWL